MMFHGDISKKDKLVVVVILVLVVILYVISCISKRDYIKTYTDEQIETSEFREVKGIWSVREYLGSGIGISGGEPVSEEDRKEEEILKKEIINKYLYQEIFINKENIESFGPPSELGYYYNTWEELDDGYFKARDDVGYEPPFLCIAFNMKDNDDDLELIIGSNDVTILIVKDEYFLLERNK